MIYIFLRFISLLNQVSLCGYACIHVGTFCSQKRSLDCLELELQAIVSHLPCWEKMWVLLEEQQVPLKTYTSPGFVVSFLLPFLRLWELRQGEKWPSRDIQQRIQRCGPRGWGKDLEATGHIQQLGILMVTVASSSCSLSSLEHRAALPSWCLEELC